jgi:hypothetical protein
MSTKENIPDPYNGRLTIPAPLAREVDSNTAWQEFEELNDYFDTQYAETESPSIED